MIYLQTERAGEEGTMERKRITQSANNAASNGKWGSGQASVHNA